MAIRNTPPIELTVYGPKSSEGQLELAKRVSDIHADVITQRINALNCPTDQKLELLKAVIDAVKSGSSSGFIRY